MVQARHKMKATQSLYLFVSPEESGVKIGVSCDPIVRAAQLPNKVHLARSFEVVLKDSSAVSLERTLHHFFRSEKKQMPFGDGCTEWFCLTALQDILDFLDSHRSRLSIAEIRQISEQRFVEAKIAKEMKAKVRAQKLVLKHLREQARAERNANARMQAEQHNASAFETFRTEFERIRTAELLISILPPEKKYSDGYLYLRGQGSFDWMNSVSHNGPQLAAPYGLGRIFTDSFGEGPSTKGKSVEFARVGLRGDLFSLNTPSEVGDHFPGADRIALYISEILNTQGTDIVANLRNMRRKLDASNAKFWRRFHEELDLVSRVTFSRMPI